MLASVNDLSDEDQPATGSQASPSAAAPVRKRRRLTKPAPGPVEEKDPVVELRAKLSKDCSCSQKTCCKQFLEPAKFEELSVYLKEWHDLAKLDQDNIVTCLVAEFSFELCGVNGIGIVVCPDKKFHFTIFANCDGGCSSYYVYSLT